MVIIWSVGRMDVSIGSFAAKTPQPTATACHQVRDGHRGTAYLAISL